VGKHLQRDLDLLKKEILSMGSMVEDATNIAEDIVFQIKGEVIRHVPEDKI